MPIVPQIIDVGEAPGDKSGDPGRTCFQKCNYNFDLVAESLEDAELKAFVVGCTAKGDDIEVDDEVEHYHMPYAFILTEVQAGVKVAPDGDDIVIDIKENGYSVLDTGGLVIEDGEKFGSSEPLTSTLLEKGSEITIDVTQVGSTTPGEWLKVTLVGYVIWVTY